ncbi:DUF4118 domain-containing protein [Phycicoccus sp. MAQZ13P-2]|uniref:DUF4118 domain-containing protein n=1 Tax=Phycicoccus mangrovi TaxID=2840470 RepID=UPI001C006F03|nr:DUF4118 domain-containing protein [Phycicoccus mangrovi]MBT9255756.1 DUF4118 domain-containing protein [Phycicoccus mangrovi]MBT9274350.1 DUF4118 domain-containing protein [Phycicoccus mangrovi]
MSVRRDLTLLHAAAAFGPVLLAALVGLARDALTPTVVALVLVLVVVAVAAAGDRLSGVVAALSAALGYDVFFTRPFLSPTIASPADVELVVALVLVGLAVSEVAIRGRRAQAASARREGYLSGVAALLDLDEGTGTAERREALARAVGEVVGVERARWHDGPPDRRDAVVGPDGLLRVDGRVREPEREGLPTDRITSVVATSPRGVVGHVSLTSAARVRRPTHEQLRVAALLVRVAAPRAEHEEPGPAGNDLALR